MKVRELIRQLRMVKTAQSVLPEEYGTKGPVVAGLCSKAADLLEVRTLFLLPDLLRGNADELVDAQNQLHGIKGARMGKATCRDVEESLRKMANDLEKGLEENQ